jgi:NAD(P)-dependent dehydrogenase (short-subunit alcohol dehydrogenase family)
VSEISTANGIRKVALITAGGSGIGRTIADSLVEDGYHVFVIDADQTAVDNFKQTHGIQSAELCDVADPDCVDRVMALFKERYGRINLLVNNAGIAGPTAAIEDISVSDWQRTVDVDLNSAFYVTRHIVPLMKEQREGVILNISSNAGQHGFPLRSPYTASKWGLIGLSKTWAMELGPWGIRVNALCPGSVSGPRIDGVINRDAQERGMTPEEIRHVYERQSSLRTFVNSEDIAAMVGFLAGAGGRHISGQAIAIDGHTEGLSNWLDN